MIYSVRPQYSKLCLYPYSVQHGLLQHGSLFKIINKKAKTFNFNLY